MAVEELSTFVLYDIPDDTLRTKIAETCKDYGLERIQFSAFCGFLTRNKREELFLQLSALIGSRPGKVLLQPVCEKDIKTALQLENDEPDPIVATVTAEDQRSEAV